MVNCLLCLEEDVDKNCIQFQSQQWLQLNILKIIETYFWQIENLHADLGICRTCWEQLYDFHIFHTTIAEAHQRNVKLVKLKGHSLCDNVEVYKTKNDMDQKQNFHLPFAIVNNDLSGDVFVKEEFVEEVSPNQRYDKHWYTVPTTAETNQGIKEGNNAIEKQTEVMKIKRKRGRPRKKPILNEVYIKKPKGKRGRPKKIVDNSEVIMSKKSPPKKGPPSKKIVKKGKRGRPRKIQITEHTDNIVNVEEAIPPAILEQSVVQPLELLETVSIMPNTEKEIKKEHKIKEFFNKKHIERIRKRKRLLQHKALMRNYIATSVRCMSFIKK